MINIVIIGLLKIRVTFQELPMYLIIILLYFLQYLCPVGVSMYYKQEPSINDVTRHTLQGDGEYSISLFSKMGDADVIYGWLHINSKDPINFFVLATTFLEMWKRREAILKWEWDLTDNVDAAEVRPEFEAEVKGKRLL